MTPSHDLCDVIPSHTLAPITMKLKNIELKRRSLPMTKTGKKTPAGTGRDTATADVTNYDTRF